MSSTLLTEKKAAKWDSLMKWIKESSETYDSDCDNGRDVDTIWDKLDSLDYQELNSKDVRIEVLDKKIKELEEEDICDDGCTIGCCGLGGECENCMDWGKKEEKSMGEFDFVDNCGEICRCNTKEEKQQAIRHISSMMDC